MKRVFATILVACVLLPWTVPRAQAADVVCWNCSPDLPGWAAVLKAVRADLGLDVDGTGAGGGLDAPGADGSRPAADLAYFDARLGIEAKEAGRLESYRPQRFEALSPSLKDPDAAWSAVHTATLGLLVNKDALGGKPVPACWKDLYDPAYRGMVGYVDPSAAAVGFVGAVAVYHALGGPANNFDSAISYFKALQANAAVVPRATAYAQVISGQIPILFDYDFNAYRAKYTERGRFEFVLPCEGSVLLPFGVGLLKDAAHRVRAERVLDYLLSDKGQAIWADSYVRPARPVPLAPEVRARFLPDRDYVRASVVDWGQMARLEQVFSDLYLAQLR